ncbi:MAG: tRNA 2-thiouridine(34) synthase MnmA [Candidatus Micrarchaeota archaeon]|nr:tRNA 2-thiouridine(34) synthase MnmA [Candidatus Micrarchaeota archaeon]
MKKLQTTFSAHFLLEAKRGPFFRRMCILPRQNASDIERSSMLKKWAVEGDAQHRTSTTKMQKRKIVVGLSGGVDSSVALLLLKQQGFEPIGVSLKMAVWKGKCNALKENVCCTDESFANAARVCEKLGVPHHIYNVEREFEKEVMGYFVRELGKGRTPNPCLVCNRDLKVKKLFGWAKRHGIKHVATGHYASIDNGKLSRATDMKKDQAYGMCLIPRSWLARLILPLGKLSKQEVYEIAIREGLGFYAGVSQSQDLCFVSEHAMKPFLFERLGKREGDIVDEQGKRVGAHYGLFLYTIGQRKGLGLPAQHFVKGFDVKRNALIVTRDRSRVLGKKFDVENFNWLCRRAPKKRFRAMVQIRTHQPEVAATITPKGRGGRTLVVECAVPIEGVAPGQVCAIYKGKVCLGGGPIRKAL